MRYCCLFVHYPPFGRSCIHFQFLLTFYLRLLMLLFFSLCIPFILFLLFPHFVLSSFIPKHFSLFLHFTIIILTLNILSFDSKASLSFWSIFATSYFIASVASILFDKFYTYLFYTILSNISFLSKHISCFFHSLLFSFYNTLLTKFEQ